MAKVVIDAKVMIPGAFGGKSLEAVGRALKEYDVFVSESILEELEGVLKRLSKKLPPEQIHYLQERVGQSSRSRIESRFQRTCLFPEMRKMTII